MSKEGFIRRLFDSITSRYDLFNAVASLGLDRSWRRRTVQTLQLAPGMTVLDLASGTGDLAREAAVCLIPLGRVVACDLSHPMLRFASRKLGRLPAVSWHVACTQGRAEALPFGAGRFDAATMGFALRNVTDLDAVFRELARVIRPGGRVALLELSRPQNPFLRIGHRLWLSLAVPAIGLLTTGKLWPFLYLRRSILQFMPPEEVLRRMRNAGFSDLLAAPLQGGTVRLYTGAKNAILVSRPNQEEAVPWRK